MKNLYSKLASIALLLSWSIAVLAQTPYMTHKPNFANFKSSKIMVLKSLDRQNIPYQIDAQGDLVYQLNDKGWSGFVIFQHIGQEQRLWNVQVRVQFATNPAKYFQALEYANDWNNNQVNPKIAMKSANKMVVSVNYPVQFGFNAKEFEINVFGLVNRMAEKIAQETYDLRR